LANDPSTGQSVSRFSLLKGFLGFEDGSHLAQPFFQVYRAEAWRITPDIKADSSRTTLDLSGEQFPLANVTAKVHQGMVRVFCAGS
jgi:hypothetical protein